MKNSYLKLYTSNNKNNAFLSFKLNFICNLLDLFLLYLSILFDYYLDFYNLDYSKITYVYLYLIIDVINITLWNVSIVYPDIFIINTIIIIYYTYIVVFFQNLVLMILITHLSMN